MTQPHRLLPILFTLNNKDVTRDTVVLIFCYLNILLLTEESTANSVLESIDIFTVEDFKLLNNRIINARNKEVGMNEKHLVIFYGVLYMIVKLLHSETEISFLINGNTEMERFFLPEFKEQFLKLANQYINELKRNYNKNNYIARSIAKINTF